MIAIETTLGELAEFRNGKALSTEEYKSTGQIEVFGSNGPIARTDHVLYDRPVIVIGRVGAYCGSVYPSRSKSWVTDNAIVAEPKPGVDFDYLYYALKALDLNRTAIGSAQPLLTQSGLKVVQTRAIADIQAQKIQAKALRLLDDKIELNRKMNETLEQIARAIFKSWFVDFDPVHDKRQGKKPFGMDDITASLFPDSFEQTELREVPRGWRVGKFSEIVTLVKKPLSAGDEVGTRPYVPIECLPMKHLAFSEFLPSEQAQSSLIGFESGDILFGSMRPYFHRVSLSNLSGVTRTTVFVLRPTEISRFYSLLLMDRPESVEYANLHSTGSTIPYSVWENGLADMPAVIPPDELQSKFADAVKDLFQLIWTNNSESQVLEQMRDLILPKVLTGEVSIAE